MLLSGLNQASAPIGPPANPRSEEHTSELQSRPHLVCRLLLEKKKFEQSDFVKVTSSRSTKLIHGGVRYLQQGNISLVMEALQERGILRRNAPHLVHDLAFVVPGYAWWEIPYYGIGLKAYDLLSGRWSLGPTRWVGRHEAMRQVPTLRPDGLRGGVLYHD